MEMTNQSNLQVSFVKSREGLFKKCSELRTLCGVDVALIVISPSGKAFSFGYPDVETVINRHLTHVSLQNDGNVQFIEAYRHVNVRELDANLTQVTNQIEAVKKHGEQLIHECKEAQNQFWWAYPIEDMDTSKLVALKEVLKGLKNDVAQRADIRITQSASPPITASIGSDVSTI